MTQNTGLLDASTDKKRVKTGSTNYPLFKGLFGQIGETSQELSEDPKLGS